MIFVIIVLTVISVVLTGLLWAGYRERSAVLRQLEELDTSGIVPPLLFKGGGKMARIVTEINELITVLNSSRITYGHYTAARKRFLANISHDIRTPLTSITGYISAVKDDFEESGKINPAYLDVLEAKSRQLKERIDKLFEIAKLESGEWQLHPETIDAAEVIREVLIDFIPELEKEHFQVVTGLPPEGADLFFDRLSFTRIVQNLVRNVLVHGKSGKYLEISLTKKEGSFVLLVRDKGPGIKSDLMARIFERSFTSPAGPAQTGSGLGLAIVKELVLLNKADITVDSREKKGTAFQVRFQ